MRHSNTANRQRSHGQQQLGIAHFIHDGRVNGGLGAVAQQLFGDGSLEDCCVRDLPVRVHQDRWSFDGFERRLLIEVAARRAVRDQA